MVIELSTTETHDDTRKRRPAELTYVEARLREWADWGRERRKDLGYPTISTLYKAMRQKCTPIMERIKKRDAALTARGSETVVFFAPKVADPPDSVAEIETVVNRLPGDLRLVIVVDSFTYGRIEEKARHTPWRRARYSQLLEAAKYSIFAALDSRRFSE